MLCFKGCTHDKGKTQQEIANDQQPRLLPPVLAWSVSHGAYMYWSIGWLKCCGFDGGRQGFASTLKKGIFTILFRLSLYLQVCPCTAVTSFFPRSLSLYLSLLCFAKVTVKAHRLFLYRAFVQNILYLLKLCLRLCACTRAMKWLHASMKWRNLSHN